MTKIDKILQEIEQFKAEHPEEWKDSVGMIEGVLSAKTPAKAKEKYESWAQLTWAGGAIGSAAKTTITRKKILDALDLLCRFAFIVLDSYKKK